MKPIQAARLAATTISYACQDDHVDDHLDALMTAVIDALNAGLQAKSLTELINERRVNLVTLRGFFESDPS